MLSSSISSSLHLYPSLNAMSSTGVPACACAPTYQVVCACGVLSCSNCGAVHQPPLYVEGLDLPAVSYLGNPYPNPLCANCRGPPGSDWRDWALYEGHPYGPPPSIFTQPRVANAQLVPENEPLQTGTGQPSNQQQPEGSKQIDRILNISRRLRGSYITGRTRELSETHNQTNQGAEPSSTRKRYPWFRLSRGEPDRPTRTTGEITTQGPERAGPLSTGETQARTSQLEEEQPAETTKQSKAREKYERFRRAIQEERQRQREREQERREEQLRRRREMELRLRNAQAFLEEHLMAVEERRRLAQMEPERRESFERARYLQLEAQQQFARVEPEGREGIERPGLLQLLRDRQKQERQREGRQLRTATRMRTTGGKPTKEKSRECTICVETYTNVQDSFPFPPALRECSEHHDMDVCVLCLCHSIKSQLESRGTAAVSDLKCPNLSCDHIYTHTQVQLLADPDTFVLYDQYCLNASLAMEPNFRRCLRGRCTNGQIYENLGPDYPSRNRIVCKACGFVMCFKHNRPWHQDLTCDEYDLQRKDSDKETETWLAKRTKPCPNCNIPIEKGLGCFHMTCRACRYEFCWECLADWGIASSGHAGHRPDCFFRKRMAPPPTAMVGSTIVEAERNRDRAAQMRARIDGLRR